jgi:uncharacterized protein YpiB (UPF0302 family)
MTPQQVVSVLRRIAGAIDNSQRPQRDKVIADLKTVIAQMQTTGQQEQQGKQQQQQGQQQQALPKSMGGKSMLKKLLEDCQAALDSGDDAKFKECVSKLEKNAV